LRRFKYYMIDSAHGTLTGTLYIIAAPSGTGKTSLVKALTDNIANLTVSISHTTRAIRPGEIDGKHYFFISEQSFVDKIHSADFLEYARVYDYYYGTAKDTVQEMLASNKDVILEIDWQGAKQIRQLYPSSVGIFIVPPSRTSLQSRLQERAQDPAKIINKRMAKAAEEISHYREFDYLVVNDDFEQALQELTAIIYCQRLKVERQAKIHEQLLEHLLAG
jgi:guanylate kinase